MTSGPEFVNCLARPFQACQGPEKCKAYPMALRATRWQRAQAGITHKQDELQVKLLQQAAQLLPAPEAGMVKAAMDAKTEYVEAAAKEMGIPCANLEGGK